MTFLYLLYLPSGIGALPSTASLPATASRRSRVGEAEVNPTTGELNAGELDGSGIAHLTVNPGTGEVCWTIEVTGVEPITEAHIHKAPSAMNGPVVVPFVPDYSAGCTKVSRELALDIVLHPSSYYVNVHNEEFQRPRGALRGQLSR